MVCYRLCLALWPSPKYYVWVRSSVVREYPAAAGSIIALGKGVVSLPIPLDLKNRPTASFDVQFIRCVTTVVPVVNDLIVVVLERPTLARSSGVRKGCCGLRSVPWCMGADRMSGAWWRAAGKAPCGGVGYRCAAF